MKKYKKLEGEYKKGLTGRESLLISVESHLKSLVKPAYAEGRNT
jgi:hypothetical protein